MSLCICSVIKFISKVMVTEIGSDITYDSLCSEMREICSFDDKQPFTMKWVDEEGKMRAVLFDYRCTYILFIILQCL